MKYFKKKKNKEIRQKILQILVSQKREEIKLAAYLAFIQSFQPLVGHQRIPILRLLQR